MAASDEALEALEEVYTFLEARGLERGEILLEAKTSDGYTIHDLLNENGPEFALRFLMTNATLDTQQVTRIRADKIHKTMLESRTVVRKYFNGEIERSKLVDSLSQKLNSRDNRLANQINYASNFIEHVGSLENWLTERTPLKAYWDLMHSDTFGTYDKCARLYLKFIGHPPPIGLGIIKNWNDHLNEFPIVVDGAVGRFFVTTGLLQPQLPEFFGSEKIAQEYMTEIATFKGYDGIYICSVALEDPISYLTTRTKKILDTLAFENGIWRFSRRGGLCLDNPSSRKCDECPIKEIISKYSMECNKDFRAYGPLFSQICQNYINYQKDVVHLCSEKTERCYQDTFEELFIRPLSPSLVKRRFSKNRKLKPFVHLMPQRQKRSFDDN